MYHFFHRIRVVSHLPNAGFLSIINLMRFVGLCFMIVSFVAFGKLYFEKNNQTITYVRKDADNKKFLNIPSFTPLNKDAYDHKMILLANSGTSTPGLWPVKTVYPNAGAILPFKRIVAYYGNLYSTNMGVLGQYPPHEMLERLNNEVKKWEAADPSTPALPALDYIAVTAQGSPGKDKKYRFRMPSDQIDLVLHMASQVNGIVFLDIQVGKSTVEEEIPLLEKYLRMPQVHLALDPEFSMKTDKAPGTTIGTMSAADINFAANYLAKLVKENDLPPKILVIHRFTKEMVTGYKKIKPLPEVQIVMDMDGWGFQAKKIDTYKMVIYKEPVQFTGFKLFYKNDVRKPNTNLMTPKDLLKLEPQPIYIQYQ